MNRRTAVFALLLASLACVGVAMCAMMRKPSYLPELTPSHPSAVSVLWAETTLVNRKNKYTIEIPDGDDAKFKQGDQVVIDGGEQTQTLTICKNNPYDRYTTCLGFSYPEGTGTQMKFTHPYNDAIAPIGSKVRKGSVLAETTLVSHTGNPNTIEIGDDAGFKQGDQVVIDGGEQTQTLTICRNNPYDRYTTCLGTKYRSNSKVMKFTQAVDYAIAPIGSKVRKET